MECTSTLKSSCTVGRFVGADIKTQAIARREVREAYEFVVASAVCDNGGEKARAEGAELRDEREHGDLAGADALRLQVHRNHRQRQAVRCVQTCTVNRMSRRSCVEMFAVDAVDIQHNSTSRSPKAQVSGKLQLEVRARAPPQKQK